MKLALKEITKIVLLAAATAGALSCTEAAKASPAKAEGNVLSTTWIAATWIAATWSNPHPKGEQGHM